MKSPAYLQRAETVLIFLLGCGIFISKPVIYLSSSLLLLTAIIRFATDPAYRGQLLGYGPAKLGIGLFFFGVIGTAIGSGLANDIAWIARKSIYLLLIGPLAIAFVTRHNRLAALSGVLLGFWIAFIATGQQYNWSWSGHRLHGGTWLTDTWAVICALFSCLLLPQLVSPSTNWKLKLMLGLTLAGSLLMLLTTGARGAWLGLVFGFAVFLGLTRWKALVAVIIIGLLAYFPVKSIWPEQIQRVEQRASTMLSPMTDETQFTRLALWEAGAALFHRQLNNADPRLWIGSGRAGGTITATEFYRNEFGSQATIKPGFLGQGKLNDLHSMYFDATLKVGLLWTLGNLLVLGWIALGRLPSTFNQPLGRPTGTVNFNAIALLTCFLVIGLTYSLLPHFATLFLVYFVTLVRRQ